MLHKGSTDSLAKTMLLQCLFFAGTVGIQWFSFQFAPDGGVTSPLWPVSGWVFACFWIFGKRPALSILLGNLFLSFGILDDILGAVLFSLVNTAAPFCSVTLLRRLNATKLLLNSLNNLLLFIVVGAFVCASLTSTLGVAINYTFNVVELPAVEFFQIWFLSGLSGIIIFAPIFKEFLQLSLPFSVPHVRFEFMLLLLIDCCARYLLFTGAFWGGVSTYPLTFLLMPIAFWAGLRMTFSEITIYVVFFFMLSVGGTVNSFGPFSAYSPCTSLLLVQLYAVTQAVMIYIIFAILTERKKEHDRVKQVHDVTVMTLASLADTRDHETGLHIVRTKYYVKELSEELRRRNEFPDIITQEFIDHITMSAPLHDIGKIGIPDSILMKPGKLSEDEFEIIKTHSRIGEQVLCRMLSLLDDGAHLRTAVDIAGTHHEKWDGSGYPYGLKGNEIPLAGRIMAVADVYDALTMERVYKKAMPHDEAIQVMLSERGKHFDPVVLDTFLTIGDRINEVSSNMDFYEGVKLTGVSSS